jgi:hypothetical protein
MKKKIEVKTYEVEKLTCNQCENSIICKGKHLRDKFLSEAYNYFSSEQGTHAVMVAIAANCEKFVQAK